MKKYIVSKTGKEIKMGMTFEYTVIDSSSRGGIHTLEKRKYAAKVNEMVLSYLLKIGLIKEVYTNPLIEKDNIGKSCTYTINAIAKRMHWEYRQMKEFLMTLNKIYPKALKDCLYRVMSLEMNINKKQGYEVYAIYPLEEKDLVTGLKTVTENVQNNKNYAIFLDKEDAEYAVIVANHIIKVFNGE